MNLAWVHFWWVLLAAPLALLLLWRAGVGRRARMVQFAHPRRHGELTSRVHAGRRKWGLILAVLALALASFAALGPTLGFTLRPVRHRGVDLLFLLDISRSMLAADLKPSRLERARRDIGGLLSRLSGERVGVVAFSGSPVLVCPLTHDYGAFDNLLARVNTRLAAVGGTDLGRGLESALEALGKGYESHQAIVILSDGESLQGKWKEALAKAKEREVRVYAIGYGSPEGAKITIDDGGREMFLCGPDGKEVVTRLAEDTLSEAAELTGGDYLRATAVPLPLDEILDKRIKVIEKREYEEEKRRVPWNRFQWPLAGAVLLLLVRLLLPARARVVKL